MLSAGFALPLAIVPAGGGDPFLSLGALVDGPLVFPVKAPPFPGQLLPLPGMEASSLANGQQGAEGGRLRDRLQQELRLVQQSIEHREKIIAQCEDDFGELGVGKAQQRAFRTQVPTSVGPWLLDHLEQGVMPLPTAPDREEEAIKTIEQHWLQELEKDEEDTWKGDTTLQ